MFPVSAAGEVLQKIKPVFTKITSFAGTLFFPPACVICGSFCEEGICPDCLKTVNRSTKNKEGRSELYKYGNLFHYARYNGVIKELVGRYKFKGEMWLGRSIGDLLYNHFEERIRDYDCLIYVPASRSAFIKRGFDQCREIALEISKKSGIGVMNVLESTSGRKKQSKLKRDSRKENAEGRFTVAQDYSIGNGEALKGKKVLLIDDILTTGSTLRECAELLIGSCGCSCVDAMVFATGRTDIE